MKNEYISTADQTFITNKLIEEGYIIPDSDGSKSSVKRNEAVMNNSFSEKDIRETLKDIYLNNSNRLADSNTANTHFYQWFGHMEDMEYIPNTNICEFKIPTEGFINSKERDLFKLSQYYRRWIKVEDILNNWNIFKWHCMLFINQRIYSEYELRIDDHETTIRFRYYNHWKKSNYPVYIYKLDTNSQCRILISKELCNNQWNWKIPVDYLSDKRIINNSNIIVAFNKISDQEIRNDGITNVEVLGDNLEFLEIKDGYIDISNISNFNKIYINSEITEYLWMSIIVPKFFHEYPILLPTDIIFRPYEAEMQPVVILDFNRIHMVKTDDDKQIYVDMKGGPSESFNGWKEMIRPIVLSDILDKVEIEPSKEYLDELNKLRDLTVRAADIIEDFRFFIKDYTSDEDYNNHIEDLKGIMNDIRNSYHEFLSKQSIDFNEEYEEVYAKFLELTDRIKEEGPGSELFSNHLQDKDYWFNISPLIHIPRNLVDKYLFVPIIESLGNNKILWKNDKSDKLRFTRPIGENDFWTFEYYQDDNVWRPYPLEIKHHFPDVYIPKDIAEENPTPNRIFKTFFFYSDTMNVLNESVDVIPPTPDWDDDINNYQYDQYGIYRDIFMEKFYWMGIRAIYKGLLQTECRWELIEYIIDNDSYPRYNELFLKTIDPYFKLGLSSYLKSVNYHFPFDDAISNMNDSINTKYLGYKKVTNFEMYLNKNWIPSYFDYILNVTDNWNYGDRLLRRPRSSFDISRLYPVIKNIQKDISHVVTTLIEDIDKLLEKLYQENYNLNIGLLEDLKSKAKDMKDNIDHVMKFTNELDMDIYSIDDINYIIYKLDNHIDLLELSREDFDIIYDDIKNCNKYVEKKGLIISLTSKCDAIKSHIEKISGILQLFDMEEFMKVVNDLRSYFYHDKINPDDNSLLGYINKFENPWSMNVKLKRDKLFQSTAKLYSLFDKNKSYLDEEIIEFTTAVTEVIVDINNIREVISEFWNEKGFNVDQVIIDKLDHTETMINSFNTTINNYINARFELISLIDEIKNIGTNFDFSDTEKKFLSNIYSYCDNIKLSLSYIVGVNNRDKALENYELIKKELLNWIGFNNLEEDIFTKLLILFTPPIKFLGILDNYNEMLNSIIEYMNTVNIEYIPDTSLPTYSDVYEVEKIKIVNGGFMNKVGDIVFVPSLGSYSITEVDGNIYKAKYLEDTGFRKTTFKDPSTQLNPFDSITSGNGIGIIVKPIKTKYVPIVNDDVIIPIVIRIQNINNLLKQHIFTCNPFDNARTESTINSIKDINTDWINIKYVYEDHMSYDVMEGITNIIDILNNSIDMIKKYIELRNRIDISNILTIFDNFIVYSYRYIEDNIGITENFSYYDNNIRIAYNSLLTFYGTGTSWNDSRELKRILEEIKYPIKIYHNKVLDNIDKKNISHLLEYYSNLLNKIDLSIDTISSIPNEIIDIKTIINRIDNKLDEVSSMELHHDTWYKIDKISVALEGKYYKEGDIVRIIPQLSTDKEGNEIHDMDDIILNDVIILRIVKVDNGRVIEIKPLMDYALPYFIWGIRDTETLSGEGYGLTVDVYSSKVELSDSSIFNDDKSDELKPDPFNENDMFMFKFENIHDININYEVFIGGMQISNFFHRHIQSLDQLTPSNIDVIYVNANEVMRLRNSSIHKSSEQYFTYYLNDMEIVDPGTGYAVGQNILVGANNSLIKLKIVELDGTPLKGIKKLIVGEGKTKFIGDNPTANDIMVPTDSLNNIDDEFNEDNRNDTFMHPDIISDSEGDPDYHWYAGSRINDNKCEGIMNTIPPIHPFLHDELRVPLNKPMKGEYQLVSRERLHNSIDEENNIVTEKFDNSLINNAMIEGDYVVASYKDLPKHIEDWLGGAVGKSVIVLNDETNNGHRMLYKIRTFIASGFFVYDIPEVADYSWNSFIIDWMNCDWYPDIPSTKAQYPSSLWRTSKDYRSIQHNISDGKINRINNPKIVNMTSYIDDLTVDDLSVFNWSTKQWENLYDESRWKLEINKDSEYGFTLTFMEEGNYSYDMALYLNKISSVQKKNSLLKRNAIIDVSASILSEVNNSAINISVFTGRHFRIRKLFPYEQKERFVIGKSLTGDPLGYEMDFKLSPYIHFKNEIHLEDIKIYNVTAGRFENILDRQLFEVRYKDDKALSRGFETQTTILQTFIGNGGADFIDGNVWGYNKDFDTHVFGYVTVDYNNNGSILTFAPMHYINPPLEDITLEFSVFQNDIQSLSQQAIVVIEFHTEKIEVFGDGYIHNVNNRLSPVPDEFKVIAQYNLDGPQEYEIIINKNPNKWVFIEHKWMMNPVFHLDDYNVSPDTVYILTDKGRFPLINPATNKPSIRVFETGNGTDVTFLNLYRRYEHLEIHSTPYPMRSVYVKRRIPENGYIDVKGKINKPLNKKYFEFWVNGKLLNDEVTIISPTKIFLHGLKSLKNLEIIEINRDPNEYFSDNFIEVEQNTYGRPYLKWNYDTYLDGALEGTLDGDNYTEDEQEYLLSPVWKQVERDHPEFKNYPPNIDIEDDILLRANSSDYPIKDLEDPMYHFLIVNSPTLENHPISERNLTFEHFGFKPISNQMLIDIMNEEWSNEIENNPYFPEHSVISDDEWYGMVTRLYDEYGILVHNLNEAAYHITDENLLKINMNNKLSRIVRNSIIYDLD